MVDWRSGVAKNAHQRMESAQKNVVRRESARQRRKGGKQFEPVARCAGASHQNA